MTVTIASIVEGEGDVAALPLVLRLLRPELIVPRPVRFPRTRLVQRDHLSRAVAIARSNIKNVERSAIVMVIDADEDCPANLAPGLLECMQGVAVDVPCHVTFIVREFENWILGGHPNFLMDNPESVGGVKRRLKEANDGRYRETVDQPRFASAINVDVLARSSPSFRRFADFIISLHVDAEAD